MVNTDTILHQADVLAAVEARLAIREAQTAVPATAIAAIANAVNTTGKFAGRQLFDTTNSKLVIATGPLAADTWVLAD